MPTNCISRIHFFAVQAVLFVVVFVCVGCFPSIVLHFICGIPVVALFCYCFRVFICLNILCAVDRFGFLRSLCSRSLFLSSHSHFFYVHIKCGIYLLSYTSTILSQFALLQFIWHIFVVAVIMYKTKTERQNK